MGKGRLEKEAKVDKSTLRFAGFASILRQVGGGLLVPRAEMTKRYAEGVFVKESNFEKLNG